MIKCPKCETDILDLNLVKCHICGADLKAEDNVEDEDDLLLSDSAFNHIPSPNESNDALGFDEDDLGIETNSSFMENNGPDETPEPAATDYADTDFASLADPVTPESNNAQQNEDAQKNGSLSSLSDEQIKNIEKNLYVSSNLLSDSEKSDLLNKLETIDDNSGFKNTPIMPKKKNQEENQKIPVVKKEVPENNAAPMMTPKTRSLAYYYKNYIELSGNRKLTDGDQIIYKDCLYILKPKSIKSTFKFGFFGIAMAVVLMIAGSFFIRDFGGSEGQIIGVALDENDQPTGNGAVVNIPDLDRQVAANSQGFFHFDNIPDGPHKVQYMINDQIVNEEYITIADGKLSSTYLRPDYTKNNLAAAETNPTSQPEVEKQPALKKATPPPAKKNTTVATNQRLRSKTKSVKKANTNTGNLTLSSNIENAKLILDGSVLGAGNTDYKNIKAGRHSYRVVSDGYNSSVGYIEVTSGKTNTLIVDLEPIVKKKTQLANANTDYYKQAQTAYNNNDFSGVIENINAVVTTEPNNADAYYIRAKAHNNLLLKDNAYSDYITAGDLFRKNNFSKSLTSYNEALKIDPKGIDAYLGRGYLYLNKNEHLAAIADFDRVTHIDKRNFLGYFGLGETRYKMEQYRKAIDHFQDAKSLDNGSPLVHQYLMLSYMQVRDDKKVKKAYDKYVEYASEEEVKKLENDKEYAAVMKIVESKR